MRGGGVLSGIGGGALAGGNGGAEDIELYGGGEAASPGTDIPSESGSTSRLIHWTTVGNPFWTYTAPTYELKRKPDSLLIVSG